MAGPQRKSHSYDLRNVENFALFIIFILFYIILYFILFYIYLWFRMQHLEKRTNERT